MVRNIFKKKSKKDKEPESGDIPLEEDKPSRPSISEHVDEEPPAVHNISYDDTEVVEPEPPQPVFIDPGQNRAFHVETTETVVTYERDEGAPEEQPSDEPKLPASQSRTRSWRSHMPHINLPRGIQNLSFRKKKEKEMEAKEAEPPISRAEPQIRPVQPPVYPDYQDEAYRAEVEATQRFR